MLPAFVDLHCHWRTPGFEYKEDIATGSMAAAAGGYTFVNLMPNTKPVCSSAAQAAMVEQKAAEVGLCDVNQTVSITENFDGSFIGDVETRLNGEGRLVGSLDSINLVGQFVADGRLKIKPLNTVYQLRNDTIRLLPDNIMFSNDTIYDRVGNIAIVNGALRHKHLTRLTYDLDIALKNLLCYDTHGYDNGATFYGTAYATGNCSIKGRSGRLDIDLDVTPEKGSFIEYDAASPEAISDQQFITWHDKTLRPDNNAMNNDDAAADDYGNISSSRKSANIRKQPLLS